MTGWIERAEEAIGLFHEQGSLGMGTKNGGEEDCQCKENREYCSPAVHD